MRLKFRVRWIARHRSGDRVRLRARVRVRVRVRVRWMAGVRGKLRLIG